MKNCQEITELLEQSKFNRISFADKMTVRLHVSICPKCKEYFKDSKMLDKIMLEKYKKNGKFAFSKKEKQEIKEKLDANL